MASGGAKPLRETNPPIPGGLETERLFGAAVKPWGIPTFVGVFGAGILAWMAGADLWILALLVTGVGAVLTGIYWLRKRITRQGKVFPPWLLAIPIIAAQLVAAGFAITYHGIDGGMWFALTMMSAVAGQSLDKNWAMAVGIFGGLLVILVAVASGQFDLARSPAIFAGSIYVPVMAGLAGTQRAAAVELSDAANRDRISLLETHNRQVEALINSLQEGLVTTNCDGRVERWNPALFAMTGRSAAEVAGAPIDEALLLSDGSGPLTGIRHPCVAAKGGGVTTGSPLGEPERDLFLVTDDETEIPVTISASPFPIDHTDHGVVAVVTDVSRERGVSEMRDSLISLVSHELRTPLTMTVGFAELLADGAVEGEDARQCAAQIRDATTRLASMIEDLLTTAVIEAGELKLVMEDVPVRTMIGSVISRFPEYSSRLIVDVAPNLTVRGDPDGLEHVFTNLVGNALKYSPSDSEVTVKATAGEYEVVISVSDKGIGIAPEEAERIFERFGRSLSDEVQRLPGTGLGLFIASEIAAAHDGRVDLASAPGEGTTFTVHLPA